MKKVLYLHGLESKQGGEKVGFLAGYVAHEFAQAFNLPAILLNPALHSRSFEPDLDTYILSYDTSFQEPQIVVLGKEDKVIDPERTKDMLQGDNRFIIEEVEGMAHRIDLTIFIDIYNKYKNG
jgi:hypothetical protein